MRLRILAVAMLGLLLVPPAGGSAATGATMLFGVAGLGLRGGGFTPLGPYASYAHPLAIRFHGDRFVRRAPRPPAPVPAVDVRGVTGTVSS